MFYHLLTVNQFEKNYDGNQYGQELLNSNSFLHRCSKHQMQKVLEKHYSNEKEVIAFEINENELDSKCVYENLSGGEELFPHIFGIINKKAICRVVRIERDSNNSFVVPQ